MDYDVALGYKKMKFERIDLTVKLSGFLFFLG